MNGQRKRRVRVWLEWSTCFGALLAGNTLIAMTASDSRGRSILFAHLMLGPLEGWLGAAHEHALPTALQVLLPSTLGTIASLAVSIVRDSRAALIVGTVLWLFSGYYFCIGMWI